MKLRTLQRMAATLSCVGMLMPSAVLAREESQPPVAGIDIALAEGGLFVGQVVDAQGAPQVKTEVALRYQGHEVVRTITDERGVFAARGLRGGQYEVVADGYVAPCRLWAAHTAPPTARPTALIVTGSDVVAGQWTPRPGGVLSWMQAHPLIVAGIVATAIAVPLALADDDDAS